MNSMQNFKRFNYYNLFVRVQYLKDAAAWLFRSGSSKNVFSSKVPVIKVNNKQHYLFDLMKDHAMLRLYVSIRSKI